MKGSRRLHMLLFAITLAALVSAPLALPERALAQFQTQTNAGALVLRALQVLEETYVDPVETVPLLNQALAAARHVNGAEVSTDQVPDLPSGLAPSEARRQFLERFGQIAAANRSVPEIQLAHAAIRAITGTFKDSHTGFLSPEQYRERIRRQRGEPGFSGIGIVLMARDGAFYVREVVPNSPAEQAGLRALDRIIRVDGKTTHGITADQISGMIRGPSGTEVVVTVQRAGAPEPLSFPIVRAPISIPSARSQMLAPDIGYVRLYQFDMGTANLVRSAVASVLDAGAQMLILDLRGNPGGFLHELNRVVEIFLPRGIPAYGLRQRGQGLVVMRTQGDPAVPPTMPLVVLVDESSASAAELLASAIQEQRRGAVIGMKTAGAVEASILVPLPDGSALSVTIARMYSGRGARLEGVGVAPDQEVQISTVDLERGQDSQLAAAIRVVRDRSVRRVLPTGLVIGLRPAAVLVP
ncbi:MAG: PDZ domain-containing protein [Armatimonadetes bacterium]|nr:PDZ domain-containing protein [Armatimonadota bacterium]